MSRITEIEIAGTLYPLNFSMCAVGKISERYGSVEDLYGEIGGKSQDEQFREILWLLELLIEQGCAYRRLVDGTDLHALREADMSILLSPCEIVGLYEKIQKAITAGFTPEIELEVKKKAEQLQEKWTRPELCGPSTTAESLE